MTDCVIQIKVTLAKQVCMAEWTPTSGNFFYFFFDQTNSLNRSPNVSEEEQN